MAGSSEVDESNACVFHALKSNSKNLSLDNLHLKRFPLAIVSLKSLRKLSAKNNQLSDENTLEVMKTLQPQLVSLNLGGNNLTVIPIITETTSCKKQEQTLPITYLHLFNNKIATVCDNILHLLGSLETLNLNENFIKEIPPSINQLTKLVMLSLAQNQLEDLPKEITELQSLKELHLEENALTRLPFNIGKLKKLQKLYVQKNELYQIPSSIGHCNSLTTLDLSCNKIQIFPNELRQLNLTEFQVEQNPLIPAIPLPSEQSDKILPLKELASRFLVNELLKDKKLEKIIQNNPILNEVLSKVGNCAVCDGPFLHSWLDCVEFVNTKKVFKLFHKGQLIPIRMTLCSYTCFNKEHNYYGIALPCT